jgi:hypothetical protein
MTSDVGVVGVVGVGVVGVGVVGVGVVGVGVVGVGVVGVVGAALQAPNKGKAISASINIITSILFFIS